MRSVFQEPRSWLGLAVTAAIVAGASGTTAGCDSVNDAINCAIGDQHLNFSPAMSIAGSASTGAGARSSTLNGISGLPNVIALDGVSLSAADVTLSGATGTGTVTIGIAVNNVIVAITSATITNGAISGLPITATFGSFTAAEATALINAIPVASRPAGLSAAASATAAKASVSGALRSSTFTITGIGAFTGNAAGTISLNGMTFLIDCSE